MQPIRDNVDQELLTLAQETDRVAAAIADARIQARLRGIASALYARARGLQPSA